MRGYYLREPHRVRLLAPWVPGFVDELKNRIPYRYLDYDREAKVWSARQPYVETAMDVVAEYYDSMTRLYAEQPSPSTETGHPIEECLRRVRLYYCEESTLYLIHGAPWPVIQSAYRATAKLAHPDTGGSNQEMTRVNLAYETLQQRHENGRGR